MPDSEQCKAIGRMTKRQCGNFTLPGSDYCHLHRATLTTNLPVPKQPKVDKLISVDDVLRIQSKVIAIMGEKSEYSAKELIAFSSLSVNYIKLKQEADKMKRIDQLEKKTSHLS